MNKCVIDHIAGHERIEIEGDFFIGREITEDGPKLTVYSQGGSLFHVTNCTLIISKIVVDKDMELIQCHARFYWDADHFFIQDMGSTNGTMINGQLLKGWKRNERSEPVEIENRSEIILGDFEIIVEPVIPSKEVSPKIEQLGLDPILVREKKGDSEPIIIDIQKLESGRDTISGKRINVDVDEEEEKPKKEKKKKPSTKEVEEKPPKKKKEKIPLHHADNIKKDLKEIIYYDRMNSILYSKEMRDLYDSDKRRGKDREVEETDLDRLIAEPSATNMDEERKESDIPFVKGEVEEPKDFIEEEIEKEEITPREFEGDINLEKEYEEIDSYAMDFIGSESSEDRMKSLMKKAPLEPPAPRDDVGSLDMRKPIPKLKPEKIEEENELKVKDRYSDFIFHFDDRPDEIVSYNHALKMDNWYLMEVAVKEKPIGIPLISKEKRVPITEPKQKEDIKIIVTVDGENIEIEEPVQVLILPPKGDSEKNAFFRIKPNKKSTSPFDLLELSVKFYYEFNLVEEAKISLEVVGKFDDPPESNFNLENPITFNQCRKERLFIDLVNTQPRSMNIDIYKVGGTYNFKFIFNNETNNKIIFTAPVRWEISDLENNLLNLRKIWSDIALRKCYSNDVIGNENDFIEDIRKLAYAGRNLWVRLFEVNIDDALGVVGNWLKEHPLKTNSIIQISAEKDSERFIFPWNLIYDGDIPRNSNEIPDPNGFWGVRYCIEQGLFNRVKNDDSPVVISDELKIAFMLWKYFNNTKEQEKFFNDISLDANGRITVSTPPIQSANDCLKLIQDCHHDMLYFYTHGYSKHRQADIAIGPNFKDFIKMYEGWDDDSSDKRFYKPFYELVNTGEFEPDKSWIKFTTGTLYLDELYRKVGKLDSKPFVFLNMCESAQMIPSLQDSFIHFFLDKGSRGVLGTECPMTTVFASPFAVHLIKNLVKGKSIGEALLESRRHFLKLNNPLGLAYTLYGQATLKYKPPLITS